MRKRGFNMYLIKEKSNSTLYENYIPKYPNHKDMEIQAYLAYTVGNDVSKKNEICCGMYDNNDCSRFS